MRELKDANHVALTTDHWTSITNMGYLIVTAYCIFRDWKLQSFILEMARVEKATTGKNIAQDLKSTMMVFKIEKKNVCNVNRQCIWPWLQSIMHTHWSFTEPCVPGLNKAVHWDKRCQIKSEDFCLLHSPQHQGLRHASEGTNKKNWRG